MHKKYIHIHVIICVYIDIAVYLFNLFFILLIVFTFVGLVQFAVSIHALCQQERRQHECRRARCMILARYRNRRGNAAKLAAALPEVAPQGPQPIGL